MRPRRSFLFSPSGPIHPTHLFRPRVSRGAFISFLFIRFGTLWVNAAFATPLKSIGFALFSSQRRGTAFLAIHWPLPIRSILFRINTCESGSKQTTLSGIITLTQGLSVGYAPRLRSKALSVRRSAHGQDSCLETADTTTGTGASFPNDSCDVGVGRYLGCMALASADIADSYISRSWIICGVARRCCGRYYP